MMRQQNKNPESIIQESPPATEPTDLSNAEIYIDDEWLEALLENLALVKLSRAESVALIEQLEAIERSESAASAQEGVPASEFGRALMSAYRPATTKVVVGGLFTAELNDYAMRSPASMTPGNVCDTIEQAVRHLQSLGHHAAVRQIVFFIASNMEEAIDEADEE